VAIPDGVVERSSDASGLRINQQKSQVICLELDLQERSRQKLEGEVVMSNFY